MGKMATREAYGKALAALAAENENVVVLDADLAGSTKTGEFKKVAPERFFDMGIAESNLMGTAAGLAASGKVAYASTFAVFATGRAYDQVRNSIAYPNLNVKICATHAGLTVGEDGATHQALEDINLMRGLPNMTVIQPCDGKEAFEAVKAVSEVYGPCYIRLGRSSVEDVNGEDYRFEIGKGVLIHKGTSPVTFFATGLMVQQSLKAIELLKENGIDPTLVNIHTIKPIDREMIVEQARKSELIVTLEEHNVIGGLGSAVAEVLTSQCPRKQLFIGVQDTFGESGKPDQLLDKYGLSAEKIAEKVAEACR